MEAIQTWVSNHKLTSIGAIWASAIGTSLAYNTYTGAKTPLKPSLRLIHARMHAQALTLAVLSGAAAYHYYEKNSGSGSGSGKQDDVVELLNPNKPKTPNQSLIHSLLFSRTRGLAPILFTWFIACFSFDFPHVKMEGMMDLVARVSRHVYSRNGVLTEVKSFGKVQLGYGIRKLSGRYFQGNLMQMTMMATPNINKELQYLNKEDRLLRWLLVKHRDTKYGLEFLNEDDGELDFSKLPRGNIFNEDEDNEDEDEDEDEDVDEHEDGDDENPRKDGEH
ncbi:hypothetical protein V6N13_012536 [Hibiscus sabdariffa]